MLLPLALLGAGLYWLATRKKTTGQAITVTGKSGTPWAVAPNRSSGNVVVWDVFLLPNGTPVMEYAQTGSNTATRQFLSSPMQANNPILIKAKSDFL